MRLDKSVANLYKKRERERHFNNVDGGKVNVPHGAHSKAKHFHDAKWIGGIAAVLG